MKKTKLRFVVRDGGYNSIVPFETKYKFLAKLMAFLYSFESKGYTYVYDREKKKILVKHPSRKF